MKKEEGGNQEKEKGNSDEIMISNYYCLVSKSKP